jgi:hypothetical protein
MNPLSSSKKKLSHLSLSSLTESTAATSEKTATMETSMSSTAAAMWITATHNFSPSHSATAPFDRTITLSNNGAVLMDQGDHHGAVKVLERAFFCFKRAYHQHHESLESCRSGDSPARHSTNVDALFSWKKQQHGDENMKHSFNANDARPCVYSNPIHLPPDFAVTQESCGFLSTSIALNLAMSHHMCGLDLLERAQKSPLLHRRTQEHFASSGRLYEYTIRLESTRARQYQEHQQDQSKASFHAQRAAMDSNGGASATTPGATSPVVPTLFVSPFALMVILNNLGHVHALMGKKETSDRYYQRLQSACMYLMVRSRTRHVGSITSSDLQIFLHNVSLGLQLIHCRSAAAA